MNKIAFPKFKKYDGQPVRYIQPKFDGYLVKIWVGIHDKPQYFRALTKNDKDITGKICAIKHIRDELYGLPNESQIFAELHCPGRFSTDVVTMLNETNEDLRLTAFAAPMLGGCKTENRRALGHVLIDLKQYGIEVTPTEIIKFQSLDQKWQDELLAYAIEQKLEGWVLKESHMSEWYKLKPTKTVDCFVIGTEQSFSPTHYGGLKCIHVAIYEQEWIGAGYRLMNLGHVGSGFEAEFRAKYDTNKKRDTLIGRVCEIEYDSIAAGGKLRFPRFVRWRTDKDKEQCTNEQLEK